MCCVVGCLVKMLLGIKDTAVMARIYSHYRLLSISLSNILSLLFREGEGGGWMCRIVIRFNPLTAVGAYEYHEYNVIPIGKHC